MLTKSGQISNKFNTHNKYDETNYLFMNLDRKKPVFTGAVFLFLTSFINPTLALKPEVKQYVAQSRTIEAKSAQKEILYPNNDRTYSYNLIPTQRGTIGNVTVLGATIVGKYVSLEGGLRYKLKLLPMTNTAILSMHHWKL